jgi:hypothetical protein
MQWQNRQLYMEQEVEQRFNNLGIQVGNKTYGWAEIDQIPNAVNNQFGSPYWDDFTEEQRQEMYYKLGLSPANYHYVKAWQNREESIAKNISFRKDILNDEKSRTASGYKNIIGQYREQNEKLDTNEILKNSHITQMQTEMVLRDVATQMAEKNEYDLARDKLLGAPPNPPRLSDRRNDQPFTSITEGQGRYK